jgi:GH24 family phage-related lysozyme (muramidase)
MKDESQRSKQAKMKDELEKAKQAAEECRKALNEKRKQVKALYSFLFCFISKPI